MTPDRHKAGSARPADSTVHHKTIDCEYKALDENGSFEVYAAVFGNVDRQGDVIEKGAFSDLDTFVADGWGAVNHVNHILPVAWIEAATQDDHGLRVRGKFHSTPEAQSCRTVVTERMKAGKSVKCSIGYLILEDAVETRDKRQIRLLKRIQAFEFSFVNLPANPEAEVIDAKRLEHAAPSKGRSMSHNQGSALQALKSLLGLHSKAGRAMSAANQKKLKAFADAMSEHHEEGAEKCKCAMKSCKGLMEEHKAMMEHHEEGCKIAEELHKCLKSFGPSDEPDADEEADEDAPEGRDSKPRKPKGRKEDDDDEDDKDEDPQDTADGDPPKGRKRKPKEDKAATIYREQLHRRAIAGRAVESCP